MSNLRALTTPSVFVQRARVFAVDCAARSCSGVAISGFLSFSRRCGVRPHSLIRMLTLVVAWMVVACGLVSAQTSNATLQGSVRDSGGGVMPGVTVKLQSPSTGLQRDVVTNASGVYVFNFLPAGVYTVTAGLPGFKSVKHDDILMEIGQSRELNIRLEVGQIEEVVNVPGTAALLDRSSPSNGTVIGSSQLKQLPLAGRH